jgi:hypothetical protein
VFRSPTTRNIHAARETRQASSGLEQAIASLPERDRQFAHA